MLLAAKAKRTQCYGIAIVKKEKKFTAYIDSIPITRINQVITVL